MNEDTEKKPLEVPSTELPTATETYSDADVDRFLNNPDERDLLRQAKLGQLSVGEDITNRGTSRAGHFEVGEVSVPEQLPDEGSEALQRFMRRRREPLVDGFTWGYNVDANSSSIEKYSSGTDVQKALLSANTSAERDSIIFTSIRQSNHIEDKLQRESWHRMWTADLRREAIKHVIRADKNGFTPNPEAVINMADAIENLGLCLADERNRFGLSDDKKEVALIVENIGAWLRLHPEDLDEYLPVVELAKLEQERRYKKNAKLYITSHRLSDRLTAEDHARANELEVGIRALKQYVR